MTGIRTGLVLVGGGSSARMGGIDKVWAEIAGKPLFMYSLERFLPVVDDAALVIRADRIDAARSYLDSFSTVRVVRGGTSRQESVWNGLCALTAVDIIAVHDVARPLAPITLLNEGIRLVKADDAAGAVPALPPADTIKRIAADGAILQTVDRSTLRAVQTPQVFRASSLLAAHAAARQNEEPATDDALLLESRGDRVVTFPGLPENFKVTTALDLLLVACLLETSVPT